jgi:hypothetical protein
MGGATASAEARRAKVEGGSDTHHVRNDRDGFREELNPSYELRIQSADDFVKLGVSQSDRMFVARCSSWP